MLLADADLLVATRTATEKALRMALRCAALAARHHDPDGLVSAWLTFSSHLDEAVRLVAKVRRRSLSSSLLNLARLLDGPTPPPAEARRGDLLRAWHQLATSRRTALTPAACRTRTPLPWLRVTPTRMLR